MPAFEDVFEVPAPPEVVWAFLLDPTRVAPCIPGCEALEVVDARTYRLRLTVKVGFLATTLAVRMTVVEMDAPRRLVAEGRGEDTRLASQVDVRATLQLAPAGAGATTVSARSEVKVLGRLGSVGDAVMKAKAREITGEFADRVRRALAGTA